MRLIMKCQFGDGYTYSCESTYPVVSESPEQALCDFEDAYTKAKKDYYDMTFAGEVFDPSSFEEGGKFYPPEFLTLDEWFKGVL